MHTKHITAAAALGLAMTGLGSALAHHSFAQFDMSETKVLSGTVVKFEWTNPHAWVWFKVPDNHGGATLWGLEMQSPIGLSRGG